MRKVAVVDADLIGRKSHTVPNLACMKMSAYHKALGAEVELKTDYDGLEIFDRVFLSKVFSDTPVPENVLSLSNISYGGTGFFYDNAPKLPDEIEHHKPDYHLYDKWVSEQIDLGRKKSNFSVYTDYSLGFLTRGCFRKCSFCVNRNYERVMVHSPLSEFLDTRRKKIYLFDDNFLGCSQWKELLEELKATKKPFRFSQGLDARLLTDEKCAALYSSRYDGDYVFAFDNIADRDIIERKIQLSRTYTKADLKFYCFCGFDRNDKWDSEFWERDIFELFYRIEILMKYRCLPYIMRFNRYAESPYRGVYISIARWVNQPFFFKKKSLREFAQANGENSSCYKYLAAFEKQFPDAAFFYDLKWDKSIY